MAYQGPVRQKASVRVEITGGLPSFVEGSNSGLFAAVTFIGAGDSTIDLDPDLLPGPILDQDTFIATIEGAVDEKVIIERVSSTQIRVRTFTRAGVAVAVPYALNMNTVFFG